MKYIANVIAIIIGTLSSKQDRSRSVSTEQTNIKIVSGASELYLLLTLKQNISKLFIANLRISLTKQRIS